MGKKVLLMNCPSSIKVYRKSKIKMAIGVQPFISLTILGAVLLKHNCEVQIIDFMLSYNPRKDLISKLKKKLDFEISISFEEGMKFLNGWSKTVEAKDEVEKATQELKNKGLI